MAEYNEEGGLLDSWEREGESVDSRRVKKAMRGVEVGKSFAKKVERAVLVDSGYGMFCWKIA